MAQAPSVCSADADNVAVHTVRRWGVGTAVAAFALACAPSTVQPIVDTFTGPNGLIASPGQPARTSPWVMTSGSLFRSRTQGWTGLRLVSPCSLCRRRVAAIASRESDQGLARCNLCIGRAGSAFISLRGNLRRGHLLGGRPRALNLCACRCHQSAIYGTAVALHAVVICRAHRRGGPGSKPKPAGAESGQTTTPAGVLQPQFCSA